MAPSMGRVSTMEKDIWALTIFIPLSTNSFTCRLYTCVYVAECYSVLQCVAVCCSVLQCVTVCCSALQRGAVRYNVLQCVAALLNCMLSSTASFMWRLCTYICVAVRCSVLQCVDNGEGRVCVRVWERERERERRGHSSTTNKHSVFICLFADI